MYAQYKLLVEVRNGAVKSHVARDMASGRAVLVHRLPARGGEEHAKIAAAIGRIPPGGHALILERGEHEGGEYIVTESQPELQNLEQWLESVASGPPAPAAEPGQFTRLFEAQGSAAEAPAPAPPSPAAGEFTRLFQSASATATTGDPRPAAPPVPPKAPGAFTKAFRALQDTPPPSAPAPFPSAAPVVTPPSPPRSSDFTRVFGNAFPLEERAPAPRVEIPAAAEAPAVRDPLPDPPVPPAAQQPGEYTRLFATPQPVMPEPTAAPPAPAPSAPAPAPAAESKTAKRDSMLPLILILGGLLILAIALVLFFAFRK